MPAGEVAIGQEPDTIKQTEITLKALKPALGVYLEMLSLEGFMV